METWYRIFGRNDAPVDSPALMEWLRAREPEAVGRFRGDELGWFEARLQIPSLPEPLTVERYLTKEDEIRGELNTWAAWLESGGESGERLRLMQRIIATAQLFTIQPTVEDEGQDPDDAHYVQTLCINVSRFLAQSTDGVYQIDGQGFFAADGRLLVAEESSP